jgi:DNA polymerase III subunit gamma/tau
VSSPAAGVLSRPAETAGTWTSDAGARTAETNGQSFAGAPPRAAPSNQNNASLSRAWLAIYNQLDLQGAARQLASHCVLLGRQGAVVRLALDPRNQLMRSRNLEEKLAQALSRHFGETVRLEFETAEPDMETPAQFEQRASQEEIEAARQTLEDDPTVRALKERFGATVLPDTVRPAK